MFLPGMALAAQIVIIISLPILAFLLAMKLLDDFVTILIELKVLLYWVIGYFVISQLSS